jgi:hypothetical protein
MQRLNGESPPPNAINILAEKLSDEQIMRTRNQCRQLGSFIARPGTTPGGRLRARGT